LLGWPDCRKRRWSILWSCFIRGESSKAKTNPLLAAKGYPRSS
jgi:hypothetical protein